MDLEGSIETEDVVDCVSRTYSRFPSKKMHPNFDCWFHQDLSAWGLSDASWGLAPWFCGCAGVMWDQNGERVNVSCHKDGNTQTM